MKNKFNVPGKCISLAVLLLLACSFKLTRAQTTSPQNPTQETPSAQAVQAPNLQTELNLTPEQIQKWRAINADLKDQQQAANQRLRLARRELADAVESPNPNEELIKQRAKEVSEAQAATTQLQALKEARILQTLTPEQRVKLKEIRERNQALIRERNQALRRTGNQQLPRNGLGRPGPVQRNPNTVAPITPKQRKLIKQAQKR
jgi:Spy/CpxP family protein refolding chaperone